MWEPGVAVQRPEALGKQEPGVAVQRPEALGMREPGVAVQLPEALGMREPGVAVQRLEALGKRELDVAVQRLGELGMQEPVEWGWGLRDLPLVALVQVLVEGPSLAFVAVHWRRIVALALRFEGRRLPHR